MGLAVHTGTSLLLPFCYYCSRTPRSRISARCLVLCVRAQPCSRPLHAADPAFRNRLYTFLNPKKYNIIIGGGPASGKGSQCEFLVDKCVLAKLHSSELLLSLGLLVVLLLLLLLLGLLVVLLLLLLLMLLLLPMPLLLPLLPPLPWC